MEVSVLVLSSNRPVKRIIAEAKMKVVVVMATILDLNFAIENIFIVFLYHQHVGLVI